MGPAARAAGLDDDATAVTRSRNVIGGRSCHTEQWRGLAARCDKHAVTYRAVVVLNNVIAWTKASPDTPYEIREACR